MPLLLSFLLEERNRYKPRNYDHNEGRAEGTLRC
jgi:hypothetical protein